MNKKATLVMLSFFQIQNSLRFSHWRTSSYAEHKALDKFLDQFMSNMDLFIEVWQGKYGKIEIPGDSTEMTIQKVNGKDLVKYLDCLIGFFNGEKPKNCKDYKINGNNDYCGITILDIIDKRDSDLLNIRDEIVSSINQLKYLLTLK